MLFVQLILEDCILMATGSHDLDRKPGEDWDVILTDSFNGKLSKLKMSNLQLSAVAALAIGYGEEQDSKKEIVAELYRIAQPVQTEDFVRVIP